MKQNRSYVYRPGALLMSRLPLLGSAAAGLLLLVFCSGSASADETVDVLTIADATGDWGFPSPYGHYSRGPGYIRMSLIFDTLIWKDDRGFVPALAESWEYLADENAYVFHLREGVTWNDGQPFTRSGCRVHRPVHQGPSLSVGRLQHYRRALRPAAIKLSRSPSRRIMRLSWTR